MAKYLDDTALAELVTKMEARYATTSQLPATNIIPTETTANRVLVSTTTAGTAKWTTSSIGSNTKPIRIKSDGTITTASTYAGGTAVTLNNVSKSASTASFYAPTTAGIANTLLVGAGDATEPVWSSATTWSAAAGFLKVDASGVASVDTNTYQLALPTTSTAGKVLKSTSTAGTVEWGDVSGGSVTDVQLNGTSTLSGTVANVQALPNYSLSIGSTNGGNPRQVLFCSVNYTNFDSNSGAYFKLGAMSGHGNGSSYTFVEDIFINVNYQGTVTCNVYKYVQASVTLDSVVRNYGDVFWVIDTTNKIVYFYTLLGQYSSAQFTPGTKIGAAKAVTSANGIVQYSGTPTYYSSGTKVWATGNSALYVRSSDLATVATSGSYNDLSDKPTIPSAVTSINGLSGGTLTSPLIVSGGDAATAAKIALDQTASGQITNNGTQTLFGFTSNNATSLTVGHSSYSLALRGSGTRPKFNGNDLALAADASPVIYVTTAPSAANTIGLKVALLDSDPSTKYDGWIYMIKES